MSQIALIVTSTTRPGMRDRVFDLYLEHLAPRAEENPAQQVVVWADDQADPDTFHLFEVYEGPEAFQANASAEFFAAYMAEAGPLLAAEPAVRMAAPRWSTGV